jgi:hemoglobin
VNFDYKWGKIMRSNKLLRPFVALVSLLTFVFASPSLAQEKSLYERLGGYDAVSAVVDDFAGKLFVDPVVGARFFGMSDDSREGFRQKNKNLVCAATGGPCKIISRSAATTHGGLGIKASEFAIVAQHLVDTLNKFKVPKQEHDELMAIIGSLRPDIVEVEDL